MFSFCIRSSIVVVVTVGEWGMHAQGGGTNKTCSSSRGAVSTQTIVGMMPYVLRHRIKFTVYLYKSFGTDHSGCCGRLKVLELDYAYILPRVVAVRN